MATTPRFTTATPDYDQLAQQAGAPDFATLQATNPEMAQLILSQNPTGDVQTADPFSWGQVGNFAGHALTQFGKVLPMALAAPAADIALGVGAAAPALSASVGVPSGLPSAALGTVPGVAGAATAGGAAAAGGMSLKDLVGALGTQAKRPAWETAASIGSGALDTLLGQQNQAANRQLQQQQLDLQKQQLAQNQSQFQATQAQQQAQAQQNPTQLNPFAQAKSREVQALLGALASNYAPVKFENGQLTGGIGSMLTPQTLAGLAAFSSPAAMQANEQQFTANQQPVTGGKYVGPDYAQNGYGALTALLQGLKK